MAYFSNGTQGDIFQSANCFLCMNYKDIGDGRGQGCPIWDAHLLYAYEECNQDSNAKRILEMLIPTGDNGYPMDCAMLMIE